jgi:pimeloyl-ACP methyl ester carboxylesterase/DNA-binding SARP family transcriptional activator
VEPVHVTSRLEEGLRCQVIRIRGASAGQISRDGTGEIPEEDSPCPISSLSSRVDRGFEGLTEHASHLRHLRPVSGTIGSRALILNDAAANVNAWRSIETHVPAPARGARIVSGTLGCSEDQGIEMATQEVPPIRFAQARGARIAYQDFGDGPATIVSIPPLAQNIEMAWEWPDIRAMLERFGSFSRFIPFDKRGTGVSDRRSQVNAIDERVDDLRAVMDAAEVDRAHLFAASEGGPMAILFAATYPDRVAGLILNGTGASLLPPDTSAEEIDEIRERQRVFADHWGTPDSPVVDRFAPSLASDPEFRAWHQRYERNAATRHSLRELMELSLAMDVREVLPELDVPTLVVHRTGDRAIPVDRGRELAEAIPGATMLETTGDDHFSYAGDVDSWMDGVERFVTGSVGTKAPSLPAGGRRIRIRTLGRFAVEVDGEDVPASVWGSRRARQLCKRLVAARGWPVTRDELIDLLWPDEADMPKLSARLSVQLSGVRRVLGGGVIADRQTVRLDLDEVSTDLEDFYKADDDAAIVATYHGEFLPEDAYEDWSAGPRAEARMRFGLAARRLASRVAESGDHRRAAVLARRLIEADRWDDEAHRLLVRSLIAAGERGEARRAHDAWVIAMAEIGVDVDDVAPAVS